MTNHTATFIETTALGLQLNDVVGNERIVGLEIEGAGRIKIHWQNPGGPRSQVVDHTTPFKVAR